MGCPGWSIALLQCLADAIRATVEGLCQVRVNAAPNTILVGCLLKDLKRLVSRLLRSPHVYILVHTLGKQQWILHVPMGRRL